MLADVSLAVQDGPKTWGRTHDHNYVTSEPVFKIVHFHSLSQHKPFLIWLLTTPPHFKYVATLPCNLSLMAFFLTLMFHKV